MARNHNHAPEREPVLADMQTAEIVRPRFEELDAFDRDIDKLESRKVSEVEIDRHMEALFSLDKRIRKTTPDISAEELEELDNRVVSALVRLGDLKHDLATEEISLDQQPTAEVIRRSEEVTEEAESPVQKLKLSRKKTAKSVVPLSDVPDGLSEREAHSAAEAADEVVEEVPRSGPEIGATPDYRDHEFEDEGRLDTELHLREMTSLVKDVKSKIENREVTTEQAWRLWRKARRQTRGLAERVANSTDAELQELVARLLSQLQELRPQLQAEEVGGELGNFAEVKTAGANIEKFDALKSFEKRVKGLRDELETIEEASLLQRSEETSNVRIVEIERELGEARDFVRQQAISLKQQRLLASIKDEFRRIERIKSRLGLHSTEAMLPPLDIQSDETQMATAEVVMENTEEEMRPTLIPAERREEAEEDDNLLDEDEPSLIEVSPESPAEPLEALPDSDDTESTELRVHTDSTEQLPIGGQETTVDLSQEPTVELPEEPRAPTPPMAIRRSVQPSEMTTEELPVEKKSSFIGRRVDSARRGLNYIFSLGKNKTSDFLRTQFAGELSDVERGERPLTKVEATGRMAAALSEAAASSFGVMLPVDAARYVSQRYFVRRERDEIGLALRAAARELHEPSVGSQERASAMVTRIEESRYLTPEQKRELRQRVGDVIERSLEEGRGVDAAFARETGEILSDAIRTRVSGAKVMKESVNTALMLSGWSALRGGVYGAMSLAERWRTMTKDETRDRSKSRIKQFVVDGFAEWTRKFSGREGRSWTERKLNQAQALGTLAKMAGLGMVTFENLPPADVMHGYLEKILSYVESAQAAEMPGEAPEVEMPSVEAPVAVEAPPLPELPEAMAPLPEGSVVKAEDGITQVLTRMIEKNPEQYGYKGNDDDYLIDRFSKLKARDLAEKAGLLKARLTEKAIDHLAILPEFQGDKLAVSFMDAATGNKVYLNDLVEKGFIEK